MTKRIQNLENRVQDLASIVDQMTLSFARPGPGSNVRLAKTTTSGTYPTTGSTFEIELENGTFTEAEGATLMYEKRFPDLRWCANLAGTIPAQGKHILVWYCNNRWWTNDCCEIDSTPAALVDDEAFLYFQDEVGGVITAINPSPLDPIPQALKSGSQGGSGPPAFESLFTTWVTMTVTGNNATLFNLRVSLSSDIAPKPLNTITHRVGISPNDFRPGVGQVPDYSFVGTAESIVHPTNTSAAYDLNMTAALNARLSGNTGTRNVNIFIKEQPSAIVNPGDEFNVVNSTIITLT